MKFEYFFSGLIGIFLTSSVGCNDKAINITDVTADNIMTKYMLKEDFGSIRDFGLDQFEPWRLYFSQPDRLMSNDVFEVKVNENGNRKHVSITEINTATYFDFDYNNKTLFSIRISSSPFTNEEVPNSQELIDYLLKEQGYQYKKTEMIIGSDRLVKIVGDYILCCTIIKGKGTIGAFVFQVFGRK